VVPVLLVLLLAAVAGHAVRAQTDEPTTSQPADPEEKLPVADFSKPMGPPDPFNRGTPRGSMYGYLSAARKGDLERAAEYLDLRRLPKEEQARGPVLAGRLKVVLDQNLWVDLVNLSDTNAGTPGDDLPDWQDRFGEIQTSAGTVTLLMQRVPRADDGVRIWKIAAATVAGVEDLYAEFEPMWLEEWLPTVFFETSWLEVPLWKWMGLAVLFVGAWLASLLIAGTSTQLLGIVFSRKHVLPVHDSADGRSVLIDEAAAHAGVREPLAPALLEQIGEAQLCA